MEPIKIHYRELEERARIIQEMEAQGYVLIHDDYDEDWQWGEEPRGTLVWILPSEEAGS